MKKNRTISAALFISLAAAPLAAQLPHDLAEADRKNSPERQIRLLPKATPPVVNKKNKGKKPAPKPASEYKFERIDTKPAYTFDKKTNPIIKEPRPKKKAVKKPAPEKAASSAAGTAAKTKGAPPAGGAGQDDGKLQFSNGASQPPPQDQPEE
jgi:hypothetical protein